MAEEKPQSSDHSIGSQRGLPPESVNHPHALPDPSKPTLAEAHGAGISGTSDYDLIGNLRGTEGSMGSQGFPEPSGGQTGSRSQKGSFELGQGDTDPGSPGEDRIREETGSLKPITRPAREI